MTTMRMLSIDTLVNMPAKRFMRVIDNGSYNADRFYQTGFEQLCFESSRSAIGETVISSVIPFDGELLIVGNSEICSAWRKTCLDLSINVSVIDVQDTENDIEAALNAILKTNSHITHVICSSSRSNETMDIIGRVVRDYKRSLIVDNTSDKLAMNDINRLGIDFMIASDNDSVSLIVARRSKLVQIEGNARVANHDLYALWQEHMCNRRSTLEPMAC